MDKLNWIIRTNNAAYLLYDIDYMRKENFRSYTECPKKIRIHKLKMLASKGKQDVKCYNIEYM